MSKGTKACILNKDSQIWQKLVQSHGYKCLFCEKDNELLTIDHIVPHIDNGKDGWENIAPACSSCNNKKDNKSIIEFAKLNNLDLNNLINRWDLALNRLEKVEFFCGNGAEINSNIKRFKIIKFQKNMIEDLKISR